MLDRVTKPGQYLGNEWGARLKSFDAAKVRLAIAFPDLYELGMSNFGLKILYQIVNDREDFMCDRSYAPMEDMEQLMRSESLPLWGWESRRPLSLFDLVGFSLQYELTYTNVLNMLNLAGVPELARERSEIFPLIFGGGPSAVNPEPMALFMDFFIIGDGEKSLPTVMEIVDRFKRDKGDRSKADNTAKEKAELRRELLVKLATEVEGIYVPSLYGPYETTVSEGNKNVSEGNKNDSAGGENGNSMPYKPVVEGVPDRVLRQTVPLTDENQPHSGIVPYLALVHDREVLEVRRGCDRGCRFCQPGYTFLPVRERSADDLVKLSKKALSHSGYDEYSLLSLCVSDYTSLHDSVRALNEEHSARRSSLSFPSQRADRMNLDVAEELKVVRKSGITLAPEAGTERLRAVINKGLSHQQIINAIEAAYQSGWTSVKLYFMCGLPTERDEDLVGIIDILKEATNHCRAIRRTDPVKYKRHIEFTCTISNFVPKPFTPFQWYGQITREETERRHKVLRRALKESGLKNVTLNTTQVETSLLEAVISRGDRRISEMIWRAYMKGATFDAWDDKLRPELWHAAAADMGLDLETLASTDEEVGSQRPWDVVHVGLNTWWLVREWEKAMAVLETPPCTENLCHACGVCTELSSTHQLAAPKKEVLKRNPFVKELAANKKDDDHHPSLFFTEPTAPPESRTVQVMRFQFTKKGELRYISHLDLQHLLARALRRAFIPVAYTNGFNPSPRLKLAQPLPLFQESECEVGEVELNEKVNVDDFIKSLNARLPSEVQVVMAREIEKGGPSLSTRVASAHYRARITGFIKEQSDDALNVSERGTTYVPLSGLDDNLRKLLQEKVEAVMNATTLPIALSAEKSKDIRSGVMALSLTADPEGFLEFELATGQDQHVKPGELLGLVAPDAVWQVTRIRLNAAGGIALYEV